jgi:hypothetical protein
MLWLHLPSRSTEYARVRMITDGPLGPCRIIGCFEKMTAVDTQGEAVVKQNWKQPLHSALPSGQVRCLAANAKFTITRQEQRYPTARSLSSAMIFPPLHLPSRPLIYRLAFQKLCLVDKYTYFTPMQLVSLHMQVTVLLHVSYPDGATRPEIP